MVNLALGIPTINRADLLDNALQLYAERWYGHHQFIVDNGNQKIKTYSREQRIMVMPKNLGVPASWNYMAKNAFINGYTHIAILNDDIEVHKTAQEISEFIENNPADFYQGTGTWCNIILPQATFEKVGEFDEGFAVAYYEDNDYAYRLKLAGLKVLADPFFNPEVYRNSQTIAKNQTLNKHFTANQNRFKDKWGGMPGSERFTEPFNGKAGYDNPW